MEKRSVRTFDKYIYIFSLSLSLLLSLFYVSSGDIKEKKGSDQSYDLYQLHVYQQKKLIIKSNATNKTPSNNYCGSNCDGHSAGVVTASAV